MPTYLSELKKERAKLLLKRKKELETQRLKREIFELKHGKKLDLIRGLGKKTKTFAERYQSNQKRRKPRRSNNLGYGDSLLS